MHSILMYESISHTFNMNYSLFVHEILYFLIILFWVQIIESFAVLLGTKHYCVIHYNDKTIFVRKQKIKSMQPKNVKLAAFNFLLLSSRHYLPKVTFMLEYFPWLTSGSGGRQACSFASVRVTQQECRPCTHWMHATNTSEMYITLMG